MKWGGFTLVKGPWGIKLASPGFVGKVFLFVGLSKRYNGPRRIVRPCA